MSDTVLVLTVGGQRPPVLRAIRDYTPSFVVFVCSSGPKSSRSQVEGDGGEEGIAAEAGLGRDSWRVVEVPPDNPDQVFLEVEKEIRRIGTERPGAKLVVDYTGGTKSMSVGAALAALANGLDLSLVAGERRDLVGVAPGTERATRVGFRGAAARFALDRAEEAWGRFAYADAAKLLDHAHRDLTLAGDRTQSARDLRARIERLGHASRMFESWDRFDLADARYLWKRERLDQLPGMSIYGTALTLLDPGSPGEPLVLLDLWHNAERRAHRRRFDDALARLYRLVEWTAQYVLRTDHRIETGDFRPDRLPEGELRERLAGRARPDGTSPIGLFDALEALCVLSPDHPFARRLLQPLGGCTPLTRLQTWIEHRNRSILAHGYTPVDDRLWEQARDWMQAHWLSWLHDELGKRQQDLPQFPRRFPE